MDPDRDGREWKVKAPLNIERADSVTLWTEQVTAAPAAPSSRDFRAPGLDELRKRVRELAVDGGTMERSAGSLAASERRTRW